jgi:CheY-like chemotaxis protein
VNGARTLELTYRSNAALLVAYATQMHRGQLVVRGSIEIPTGAEVVLRLVAPAATVDLSGVVAGAHSPANGSGRGAELALAVPTNGDLLDATIDRLAFEFAGLKALVAASQAAPRALLIRYLHAIVTCEVIEVDQRKLAEPGAISNVDLAVIDLDSSGAAGYELYARLREHAEAASAPVLAVAQMERDRARATALGFDEALANPPAFADLHGAVLRCLAKPVRTAIV